MTQPLMYNLIEAKRSVRTLYTEALMGRGDLTEEELDAAQKDFQGRLEEAFQETHAAQTGAITVIPNDDGAIAGVERPGSQRDNDVAGEPETTGIDSSVLALIGDAHANQPPDSPLTRSSSRSWISVGKCREVAISTGASVSLLH